MKVRIHKAVEVPEGDGVMVKRLMPAHGMRHFDPFVLWDHFDIASGGFPDHPHRGFEAITYMFAGGMQHKDNLGNEGTVHAGGAQRFTAGHGIVHSEMPAGHAAGIQLWINLPKHLKQTDPAYQQVDSHGFPEEPITGGVLRTIVGAGSPLRLKTEMEYLEIRLGAGASFSRDVRKGFRGLIYVVAGAAGIDGTNVSAGDACYIDGHGRVEIVAAEDVHLMWCFGAPHHEPILQHGPFVD
ncbi:MAG: pirin family protein [Mariprofundaceae bacterium]